MSQDVSTKQRVVEPLTAPRPIQPWSAEAEADKLMNELFSDIDRMLEGSSKLPTEPIKPEYISLQSIILPQLAMPPAVRPLEELQEQPTSESSNATLVEQPETPAAIEVAHPTSSPPKQGGRLLEKLLLAAGVASVVVAGILMLTTREKLTWPWSQNLASSPSPEVSQLSESDAQFVNYILRSLEVIDRKTKTKPSVATTSGTPGNTNQQALPAAINRPPVPNQAPTVLERVYIPVPMPQANSAPSNSLLPARPLAPAPLPTGRFALPSPLPTIRLPLPSPLPTVKLPQRATSRTAKPSTSTSSPTARRPAPAPSPAAKRSAPAPSPAARRSAPAPSPAARRSAPAPSPAARRSAPAPSPAAKRPASTSLPTVRRLAPPPSPQAVAPAVIPSLPTVPSRSIAPNSIAAQSSVPTAGYTLVGLLELGDRSAALFEVDGVTQRFNIGESIGASGWTLVSVANQEAVVRRNGEVRSVYVGQKF
jgi:hypothetical protein